MPGRKPLLAAALLAAIALPVTARAETPLTIRFGSISLNNALAPVLFAKQDILPHYGKSYVVEMIHFAGSSTQLTALASGDVNIASLGFAAVALAVQNAHMDDIRVVADGFQDGVEGYLSTPFLVRNDSGIATVEDLKGKLLVSNAFGGGPDIALRAMMRQHGMEDKRDFTLIEAEFSAMPAMLLEHKVDLVGDVPPFINDPRLKENAHPLFRMRDSVGRTHMSVLAARAGYLAANRAALEDFFEDMVRGMHWFLDPANREAAIDVVARAAKQPRERFESYLYTKGDYYHDPNGRPDLEALQHDMETQRSLGFIKADLDVAKYTDLSFLDEAAKRLK